jgi:hypothetical protein
MALTETIAAYFPPVALLTVIMFFLGALYSDVQHAKIDISEIKTDIHELRNIK